jgi:stage II sporulation protein D
VRRIIFLPLLTLLWLFAACGSCDHLGSTGLPAPNFGPTEGVPTIRVALRRKVESARIGVEGAYTAEDGNTGKMLSQGASLPVEEVTFKEGVFSLTPINTHHIILKPATDGSLVVGTSHYRGVLHLWGTVIRDEKGNITGYKDNLTVVNHVNIEHYLASVIPAEMKISWPEPALQAQAVAARTYAIWRIQHPSASRRTWDLTSGSDSQVYAGLDKESEKSRKVVVDTAGTVLLFEGEIFPTYYHSTCGGYTADAHVVFGGKEMPCLTGVPCGNCRDSPVFQWSFTLDQNELAEVVEKTGKSSIGKILEIKRIDPDGGERPIKIILKGEKGELHIPTTTFRRAVGSNRMKACGFTVEKFGDSFKIDGYGWGHGVGMCQWGAAGMADPLLGFTAEEILKHYYRETELQRIY